MTKKLTLAEQDIRRIRLRTEREAREKAERLRRKEFKEPKVKPLPGERRKRKPQVDPEGFKTF